MSIKLFLRTIVFLAALFVILYVGMTNPKEIDFYFPLLSAKPSAPVLHQPAALIYFSIFAIGVLAGRCSMPAAASATGAKATRSSPSSVREVYPPACGE